MLNVCEFPPSALLYTGEVLATWSPPQLYNPQSGQWRATGNFVQPTRGWPKGTTVERAPDGTYRLTGSKIFITYGEHDLTDNIIHFVLARLPDAPPGTRGISQLSLFLLSFA
jgi:alkylation response protein AidB-like acyl-CoA dehydrogenase